MSTLHVPYRKYKITPEGEKPVRYIYRPVILVDFLAGRKLVPFAALIDSGADRSTFPGAVLRELGRDIQTGEQCVFTGIGGSVLAYRHPTRIHVAGMTFRTDLYYSNDWDAMPFGLLGHAGFFSRFDVHFHYRQKLVELTPYHRSS